MKKMFKKILYIGAGLDLSPLSLFSDTKSFIFIDSLPRNEYGRDYYYRPFYRKDFVNDLINKVESQGFNLVNKQVFTNNYEEINVKDLDSTLLYFSDKQRVLRSETSFKYYISTGIPCNLYENDMLINDIKECDTLFVSGHEPDSRFIPYLTKSFHFVGNSGTSFPENIKDYLEEDDNDKNGIFYNILTNNKDILSYTLIDERTKKKYMFDTYEKFYDKYRNVNIQ
jgi:hypothetical protein